MTRSIAALGRRLDHEDVAVQHNAAGALGRLSATHPEAVEPVADRLGAVCDHEVEAVRRVAAGALTRLARERPEALPDRCDVG